MARIIATWHFLDFNDFSAHIGKHQGTGWPRHYMGQIYNLQSD